jgi:hypothetical protein
MSEATGTRLFDLLPAIYRQRDAERGGPLRALLSVIEREVVVVESDIAHLYDDWFIETADEWVISYIGDLLGVRGLAPVDGDVSTQRAFVANTIGYRRRKGTASVLEQLARDVTGWPAHVVEYFGHLEWEQYANHVRPGNLRTPDLRDTNALELLRGPLGTAAHTVDVRHIDRGRGRFNIPNIGLHLWRLQAYAVGLAGAREVGAAGQERHTFDPLGRDLPLFNTPRTEAEATQISREENLPLPLRRRALFDELEVWRQALVDESEPAPLYFRPDAPGPVFEITVDDEATSIPPESVLICNLADWRRPNKTKSYVRASDGVVKIRQIRVAVDPVLGRLTYPNGVSHTRTRVSYAYGFSGDVGGGPYDRRAALRAAQEAASPGWSDDEIDWQIGVSSEIAPVPGEIVPTIGEAVAAWNARPPGSVGVIAVMDSASYAENLTGATRTIRVPAESKLLLVAASWPEVADPLVPGGVRRDVGRYVPDGLRPHLRGNVAIEGLSGGGPAASGGLLIVDGLVIEGKLTVTPGDLGGLVLANSTVAPGHGGLAVNAGVAVPLLNNHLEVQLRRSICGRVRLADPVPRLAVVDTIVDATLDPGTDALTARGAALDVQTSTVLGRVIARTLDAGNSIFRERVAITRRQTGCVRFCYLPLASTTARRYRCQPTDPAAARRVFPQFSSTEPGQPGYLQLAARCPTAISEGAEDEGEMGAFHFLQSGRRVKNLAANLDQYLRFGMEAGIFLVS